MCGPEYGWRFFCRFCIYEFHGLIDHLIEVEIKYEVRGTFTAHRHDVSQMAGSRILGLEARMYSTDPKR